ncbi:hypothetical protein FE257_012036 [Aspergillus nanangensis]|uniref:Uncharacterized protein n=1 Tax=Aspergillus nanangensis TaxID=2582783 RepID=A0AAD4CGJ4_ASPNN|nr:hypothetical protein FE257_012036 [Aspergillus nanangensis]
MTVTDKSPSPVIRRIKASDGPKAILRILGEDGCAVIQDALSLELIQRLNRETEPQLGKGGGQQDDDWINEGHRMKTKYLSSLPVHSKSFRDEILNQPLIHEICEGTFREESGDYWLTKATIIEIGPEGSDAGSGYRLSMVLMSSSV